ncbi:MAG: S41 family peptidase [Bacteroidota bacterium]
MRILILISYLILSLSAFSQWNQYQNLDFSQKDEKSDTQFRYWKTAEHVTAKAIDEQANTRLELSGSYTENKPAYAYQQYEISLNDFKRLRISADVNSSKVSKGSGSIYAYFKNGEQWLSYKQATAQANSDWKRVEFEIIAPPNADRFRIGTSMEGEGKLLVDNFKIEEIALGNCGHDAITLAFMQEVVDTIKLHSLFKAQIDKKKLLNDWKMLTACKEDKQEVYDALGYLLRTIDNHSFHWPKEQVEKWENTSTQGDYQMEFCEGYHIEKNYAYLTIPSMGSGDTVSQTLFATKAQRLIDSLDNENIKGWIVDLRQNGGGNCWPMLVGVGPLLGEEVAGYFAENGDFSGWKYKNGVGYQEDAAQSKMKGKVYQLKNKQPKIAVLYGSNTASSGEIMAVSFKNHPNAKTFGQKTAGYSTGNVNFTLSNGSMLFLATSVYADRMKNLYPHGVEPDVVIEEKQDGQDLTLAAALEWLKEK